MTNDLVLFAKLQQEANDIEPWAEIIKALSLSPEDALWVLKLYNAYDDLNSAWKVFVEFPTPKDWYFSSNKEKVAHYFIGRERRSLYGGRIIRHLNFYVEVLREKTQFEWVSQKQSADPIKSFRDTYNLLLSIYGVGRLTGFEWVEFITKVMNAPLVPQDALLWESSGPRESLERIYENDNPTKLWLKETAQNCKEHLSSNGVELSWWDFETVICDFNVMKKGRYYPGKHIAMVREEIMELQEPHRSRLREAFNSVIPLKWREVPLNKPLGKFYVETGVIFQP